MKYIVGVGVTDLACEIMFTINGSSIKIDIVKQEIETAKLYYQALVALSLEQVKNEIIYRQTMEVFHKLILNDANQFNVLATTTANIVKQYRPENYSNVFQEHLGI
jgi:hypothetical protein